MRNYLGKRVHSRKERSILGLCSVCGERAISKRKLCINHLDEASKRTAKKRRERIEKGLCGTCGTAVIKGKVCETCRAYMKTRLENRIKNNLCTRCAAPAQSGRKTCDVCTQQIRKYHKQNAPNRNRYFFLAAIAQVKSTRDGRRKYGASSTTALDLLKLWKKQKGICGLSGLRLNRDNSEIDHIIPASKGGSNNIENLRWAHKDANRAKQALTDEEFIRLCKLVVDYSEVNK